MSRDEFSSEMRTSLKRKASGMFARAIQFLNNELLPGGRTRCSIISGQRFEIQDVDDVVVIQVCCFRRGRVIAHADGHCIELIDHVVAIDVTAQEGNRRQNVCNAGGHCHLRLGTQEARRDGNNCVGARCNLKSEIAIQRFDGCDEERIRIIDVDDYWLADCYMPGNGRVCADRRG